MPSPDYLRRREFLKTAASLSPLLMLPRHRLAGADTPPASSKLNIAGIGVGGIGAANLQNLESENIVALCDVDPNYAAKTIARYPHARIWTDYREMLEKQKDLDAVMIATPDHTHAVIAMAAIRAGKHVYCQKPLCHDIYEARELAKAAAVIIHVLHLDHHHYQPKSAQRESGVARRRGQTE